MNRREFLKRLEQSLEGEVARTILHENLVYYEDYIVEECKKGLSEQEVIGSLGDPRLIAKTIIEAEGLDSSEFFHKEYYGKADEDVEPIRENPFGKQPKMVYFNFNKWYWQLLAYLIPIFFIFLMIMIFKGIISLIAFVFSTPLLIILMVYLIYKYFIKK